MAAESQAKLLDDSHTLSPETEGYSNLLLITATEVAEKICRGDTTAEAVLCEYIKRIESVNPAINAVVANRFEVRSHYFLHSMLA